MSADKATKHGQEYLKGQGSCYLEEQGRGIPGCRQYCIPWPGSWLQGSLFLPICQPVCMFCALYDVSVLKFRKRRKNSDREEGRKEGGREERRRDSHQGAAEGKTGGSSPGRRDRTAVLSGAPALHHCELLLSCQEQVLQDWKSSVLMYSFILRNKKRFDSLHKLMNELI